MIISLREDEAAVAKNLRQVDSDQNDVGIASARRACGDPEKGSIDELVRAGRLEVSYYPPGFIAPEEFFHRVQLSIARQKKAAAGQPVLLVFNSLDLLHSHFPLCAEHSIFVPALVEMLCFESVTSFFIATSPRTDDRYGLMSMADPVLRFSRHTMDRTKLAASVFRNREVEGLLADRESIVKMVVERFAAGVSAGAGAYLALIDKKHPLAKVYGTGLKCFSYPEPEGAASTGAGQGD